MHRPTEQSISGPTPRCAAVTDCYLSGSFVTGVRRRAEARRRRLCKYPLTNRRTIGIDSAVANKSPSRPETPNVTTAATLRRYTWLLCPCQPLPTATW
ncbi:hypothetical protein BCEP4_1260010 [Burkholderia cepacia]|nr:hypothetical protein BCEP4_1260010 [Burkholderia cepacia]